MYVTDMSYISKTIVCNISIVYIYDKIYSNKCLNRNSGIRIGINAFYTGFLFQRSLASILWQKVPTSYSMSYSDRTIRDH